MIIGPDDTPYEGGSILDKYFRKITLLTPSYFYDIKPKLDLIQTFIKVKYVFLY